MRIVIFIVFSLFLVFGKRYDNYSVMRFILNEEQQKTFFKAFPEESLDIWSGKNIFKNCKKVQLKTKEKLILMFCFLQNKSKTIYNI
jgi:hypothetical protein